MSTCPYLKTLETTILKNVLEERRQVGSRTRAGSVATAATTVLLAGRQGERAPTPQLAWRGREGKETSSEDGFAMLGDPFSAALGCSLEAAEEENEFPASFGNVTLRAAIVNSV